MTNTPTPEDPQGTGARLISVVERLSKGLEDTADRLQENDERIDKSNEAISALAASNRRNKRTIMALAGSVTLDVILSIILGIVGVTALHASSDATNASRAAASLAIANAENIRNTCLSSNEGRALNIQLWDYVLGLNASNNQDPARAQQAKDFQNFVHTIFAPKDCGPDPTPGTPDAPTPVAPSTPPASS